MRQSLLINLLLAVLWVALTGTATGANFLFGFLLGYLIALLLRPLLNTQAYTDRLRAFVVLGLTFSWNLVRSSIQIAVQIVTPRRKLNSAVIAVPLDVDTDAQLTLVANMISLTPGTLTLDHSEDRRTLYVHVMDVRGQDVEAERRTLKRQIEQRVQRTFGTHHAADGPTQPRSAGRRGSSARGTGRAE